jgi:DNA-binding CsgD family transcriptional regulator
VIYLEDVSFSKRLAPVELAILSWISVGKETGEIQEIIGLDTDSLETHITQLEEKLGARDKDEAVELALARKII